MRTLIAACFLPLCLHANAASAQAVQTIATNGAWKTECRFNQIMKRRECDVTFAFAQSGSQFIAGKIFVDVFKKQITVFAADNPTAFTLAVDQGQAAQAKCNIGCTIDGAPGAALFQQMLKGKSFRFAVSTGGNTLQRSESLAGFAESVAAANK